MKKQDSYIFLRKWWTMIQAIPADYRDEVMCAINAYVFDGATRQLSTLAQGIFMAIKLDIDNARAKRDAIGAKRAEAGRKGAQITNTIRWSTPEPQQNMSANADFADFCRLLPTPIVTDTEYIYYNNYILSHPNAHTREEICYWICGDEDRLKLTMYRAGAISSNMDRQTLIRNVFPYVCKFYEYLIMQDRNMVTLDRKDTISHFSNWLPIHIKKVKQDDTKNPSGSGGVSDPAPKIDYKQRF